MSREQIDAIMTKAQEFASSWSLVGGRFDDGTMLAEAEARKSELRAAIAALTASPQAAPEGMVNHIERHNEQVRDQWDAALASPQAQGGEVECGFCDCEETEPCRKATPQRAPGVTEEMVERAMAAFKFTDEEVRRHGNPLTDWARDLMRRALEAALASGPSWVDGVVVPRELPTAGIAVVLDYINENIGRITPTKMWRLLLEKIEVRP